MKRIEVRQGDRYGMLTVVRELPPVKGKRYFECKCKCGNVTKTRFVQLRNGEIKSCGCMRNYNNKVPLYHSWIKSYTSL